MTKNWLEHQHCYARGEGIDPWIPFCPWFRHFDEYGNPVPAQPWYGWEAWLRMRRAQIPAAPPQAPDDQQPPLEGDDGNGQGDDA